MMHGAHISIWSKTDMVALADSTGFQLEIKQKRLIS